MNAGCGCQGSVFGHDFRNFAGFIAVRVIIHCTWCISGAECDTYVLTCTIRHSVPVYVSVFHMAVPGPRPVGHTDVHLNAEDLTRQNHVRYTIFVWQSPERGIRVTSSHCSHLAAGRAAAIAPGLTHKSSRLVTHKRDIRPSSNATLTHTSVAVNPAPSGLVRTNRAPASVGGTLQGRSKHVRHVTSNCGSEPG